MKHKNGLLGDVEIKRRTFADLDAIFKQFHTKEFNSLIDRKRSEKINRTLLELIQKEPEPCFLLPQVLDFVERVDTEKLLQHYKFSSFEIWLNHFSELSFEENYKVRGKIAGKWIDRSDYQALFPIGMGKVYEGTHFVTAHKSPDLDTTIASFWGWLDAFAARVGDSLHVWNLPGGPPPSQIEIDWIFRDLFGPAVFTHLPKTKTALHLSGNDLMSQKGMLKKTPEVPLASIDHDREKNAVVIVDEEGFYLGDWRHLDVEGVQHVIVLLSSCLRWFENNLHLKLISLFAKDPLNFDEIEPLLRQLFGLQLQECEPAQEFTARQKSQVDHFIVRVLHLKSGMKCTLEELGVYLAKMAQVPFDGVEELLRRMRAEKLFDAKGHLIEQRPKIFHYLEQAVKILHEAIFKIRGRLERLDIALKTKREVFEQHPTFVTVRSDVEEIKEKMGNYSYLTVNYPDDGRFFPVGIIPAAQIRKSILGTVSLRDFCNRDEMGIPAYLEVISVIDHHKSALNTFGAPMAIIADAQSSNSLVADRAFEINDRYSLSGQTKEDLSRQIEKVDSTAEGRRLLMRLLKRSQAADMKGHFFIHPEREYIEYLHFLYGIIDDTDLLSKVSVIDVEIMAQLLNRLKSLSLQKEVEIVNLDDIPRDKSFAKRAAQRILQNEDMYSLYRRVYAYREKEVAHNIELASQGKPSNLFADTKEQNGCCRVGQTKIFANNVELYEKKAQAIQAAWLAKAQEVAKKSPEIDLHIHMISTIVSADEVHQGTQGKYKHKDELWIWVSGQETSVDHLKRFLNSFQHSPGLKNNPMDVEFLGENGEDLSLIFRESFAEIPRKATKGHLPIAVLRYNAGSLNSRKAMVSPFLPTVE
ncbi:MAG: hypothetical protein JSS32_03455 [Verrucomicrobia bacterium]|nr:hypothetical protein [Verrucomicrobiota bacterium]